MYLFSLIEISFFSSFIDEVTKSISLLKPPPCSAESAKKLSVLFNSLRPFLNDNIIFPKTSSVILTESPKKDKGIPKFDDFNKNKNPSFSKFFDDSEVHNTMVLPSWFKTRAELWLSEEISDEKFNLFLNSAIGAIDCKENFEMIIKINGNPSCVKPETVEKLIERGWGMKKPKSTVQKLELKPTKNTTYYSTYFSLYDQGGVRLDDSLFSLYINASRKDFGLIELESDDVLILVQDFLNVTVFNQVITLNRIAEYNIIITIFELQIRHLARISSNVSIS
ncbi:hypothetical protein LCGC14_3152810, partial [marine sediment metagenome]